MAETKSSDMHDTKHHGFPGNVVLKTSMGELEIELYWNESPNTCRNFFELARRGYYNMVIFHRVIKNFITQSGDPTGTGTGGISIYGDVFDDEDNQKLKHTGAGIVSMANYGPNTNGSQFFITLAPTPQLDGKYVIFGRVKKGITVLNKFNFIETDCNNRPQEKIYILEAYTI